MAFIVTGWVHYALVTISNENQPPKVSKQRMRHLTPIEVNDGIDD